MRWVQGLWWLTLALSTASAVPPGDPRAQGTATRSVAEYSALELQVADLVAGGDRAGLEAVLAEDFLAHAPTRAAPLGRRDYIALEIARRPAARIFALSVLERGDLDVVSYLVRLERDVRGRRVADGSYVIDVWRRADHRLLARYAVQPRSVPAPPSGPERH